MKTNNTNEKILKERGFIPEEVRGYSLKEIRPGSVYLYYFRRKRDKDTKEILPSSVVSKDSNGKKKYADWYQEEINEIISLHNRQQAHLPKSEQTILTEEEARSQINNRVKWEWRSAGRWNAKGEGKTEREKANATFLKAVKEHMPQEVIDQFLEESFQYDIIFEYEKDIAQAAANNHKDIKNQFGLEMKKIKVKTEKRVNEVMKDQGVGKDKAQEIVRKERFEKACKHNKDVKELMDAGKTEQEALTILYNNTMNEYRING